MTTLTVNSIGKLKTDINLPDELSILEGDQQPQEGCGCFRIISQEDGDKRVVWRKESLAEINAAKDMFNDLVSQGLVPHRVGSDGHQNNEVMREFDPHAEEVIFLPMHAVAGG